MGFAGGSVVKNLPANAEDAGSIPGLEDPLEKEMATHSSTLVRKTPWTEEPGRLQSMGVAKSQTRLSDFTHFTRGEKLLVLYWGSREHILAHFGETAHI